MAVLGALVFHRHILFIEIFKFECNTTSDWLNRIGLANQKLSWIQMFLNIEKSEEQDNKPSLEWLVNMEHDWLNHFVYKSSVILPYSSDC